MNNSELNRDNDQLVSTEEVSLEQSNVGNVSAAEHDKGSNNSIENRKGNSQRRILLICVLLAVLSIPILIVLTKTDKNNVAEEAKPIDSSMFKNKGLDRLRGWGDLSPGEREEYLKQNPSFAEKSWKQMEIIYANRQYIDRFGEAEFDKYEKETRDRQYKESIVRQAAYDQFGEDTDLIKWLNGLTLQEKIEFLETNYQASYNFENEWQEIVFDSRTYDIDSYDWYTIENYTIPIPKTMYLKEDTCYNFKYLFVQKDPSKYSSISVNCHYGDYSWMANFLSGQKRHYINEDKEMAHLREAAEFRASFKDEARIMEAYSQTKGMIMSNSKGPDFIDIGGQIVLHAEYDQTAVSPVNHVDTYSFYSPTTFMMVITNYPVTEANEWKDVLKNLVSCIRCVKY